MRGGAFTPNYRTSAYNSRMLKPAPKNNLANTRLFTTLAFLSPPRGGTGFSISEAKALFRQKLARKWGHAIARGWATLLLDRLRDFVVVPSSAGGNSSSFELHSQSMEERATLDRYHHFHGHSGMCA